MEILDASLLVLALMGLWTALEYCWRVIQDAYAEHRRNRRARMTRLDGPFKLLLLALLSVGCAADKTIILRNMPSTLIIHRGTEVADKQCESVLAPGDNAWGCAQRLPAEDSCEISLDYDRPLGVTVHELAHCAGHDEDEAEALAAPETE
jgi:hypothetical protein